MAAESDGNPVEVDDLIVLLLGAPTKIATLRDRIEGVTRLEKLVFLLENETPIARYMTESADFASHNFGPFSAKIYQAVDTLVAAQILEDSATLSSTSEDAWEADRILGSGPDDPYATRNFRLTDRGRRYYKAVISELPEAAEQELNEFKDTFGPLPLRRLIRYVYQKYPAFTDKSLIRDDILGG